MKAVNFYEVQSSDGSVEWGGASALLAVEWFRRGLDNKLFVSVWDEEDIEEPRLINDKIEVTSLVLASIMSEKERGR